MKSNQSEREAAPALVSRTRPRPPHAGHVAYGLHEPVKRSRAGEDLADFAGGDEQMSHR